MTSFQALASQTTGPQKSTSHNVLLNVWSNYMVNLQLGALWHITLHIHENMVPCKLVLFTNKLFIMQQETLQRYK